MESSRAIDLDAEPLLLARANWIVQFWFWLTTTRSGLVTIWAALGFLLFSGVLFGHVFGPWSGLLNSDLAKLVFAGGLTLVLLPLLLLGLDPTENLQRGPSLLLPSMWLALLLSLTLVVVFDAVGASEPILGADEVTSRNLAARIVFFSYFGAVFIPAVWNASNFARYEQSRQDQIAAAHVRRTQINSEKASEALGALIATAVAIGVAALAYMAGQASTPFAFENFYGLVLCAIVIGVFAIVAFLEALSETAWVQALARHTRSIVRHMRFLADFYDAIDAGLVRIGAEVAGMGQREVLPRYFFLAGSLLCLCVMAWYLPPPLGLAPALVGFVLSVSVSRLWAWVESDRSLAAMTEYRLDVPYRVGFREDFRDEAMLGFMFVFVLLPIAMMQAHEGHVFGTVLFDRADHRSFFDWFGFFGVELAKAVPIVNWSEVYNIRDGADVIGFSSAPSKHIVFLARVTIDMVLLSALLQAIGIAERNRNQKRLFSAGHIRRFDELVERSELARAVRATRQTSTDGHVKFDLNVLGKDDVVDFRRYDRTRLKTIYWATKNVGVREFIEAIATASAGKVDLSTAMDLTLDLTDTTRDPSDMTTAFSRALDEHRRRVRIIDVDDLYTVLFNLRSARGLRDFKFDVIDRLISIAPAGVALQRLSDFAGGPLADFQYTRRRIAGLVPSLVEKVYDAHIVEVTLTAWRDWNAEERPNGPEYSAAVQALRQRLNLLRGKPRR